MRTGEELRRRAMEVEAAPGSGGALVHRCVREWIVALVERDEDETLFLRCWANLSEPVMAQPI